MGPVGNKKEEGYIPGREGWSKIVKSFGQAVRKKDPKQAEPSLEMPLHAWLRSLEFDRQWQTFEGLW